MPNHDNTSTGRRPSPGSAGAESVVTLFTALSDTEWEAIHSTREDWPEGVDWRREIERIAQDYWEMRALKKMWVDELRGKQPAKQRKKIRKAEKSMHRLQKNLAELAHDGLLGDELERFLEVEHGHLSLDCRRSHAFHR